MKVTINVQALIFALGISCLLHAALMLVPLFGTNVNHSQVPGANESTIQSILLARLLSATTLPDAPPVAKASVMAKNAETISLDHLRTEELASNETAYGEVELFQVARPHYYPSASLTKRPQPTSPVDLNTPEMRLMTDSGIVVIVLKISSSGNVVAVDIEKSEVEKSVSESAMAVFGRMQFTPGEIDSQPVASEIKIEITYSED